MDRQRLSKENREKLKSHILEWLDENLTIKPGEEVVISVNLRVTKVDQVTVVLDDILDEKLHQSAHAFFGELRWYLKADIKPSSAGDAISRLRRVIHYGLCPGLNEESTLRDLISLPHSVFKAVPGIGNGITFTRALQVLEVAGIEWPEFGYKSAE